MVKVTGVVGILFTESDLLHDKMMLEPANVRQHTIIIMMPLLVIETEVLPVLFVL